MSEENNNQPFEPISLYDEVVPLKPIYENQKEQEEPRGVQENVDHSIDHTHSCVVFHL